MVILNKFKCKGTGEVINDISYQIITPEELERVFGISRTNLELK